MKEKKFWKKIFFEKSIFLWRHNAISKNFSWPSRTHPRDSIDTSFVQIGQEMRKWQPKRYEKCENRKSLGPPPLRGGVPTRFWFFAFLFCFQHYSAIYWWTWINHVSMESVGWVLPKNTKKLKIHYDVIGEFPKKVRNFFPKKWSRKIL